MHIERIQVSQDNRMHSWEFTRDGRVRAWTLLRNDEAGARLLRFIVVAGTTRADANGLGKWLKPTLLAQGVRPVELRFVQVRHAPQETMSEHCCACGWRIDDDGCCEPLPASEVSPAFPGIRSRAVPLGKSGAGWLLLAYGERARPHCGGDSFGIEPGFRLRRVASLFDARARHTDPMAFLHRLHYKGVINGRPRAGLVLRKLSEHLSALLGFEAAAWLDPRYPFEPQWKRLPALSKRLVALTLDMARHAFDASLRLENDHALRQTGIAVLDRVGEWCPVSTLVAWATAWDRLFPGIQFFLRLPAEHRGHFPQEMLERTFELPRISPKRVVRQPRIRPGAVLLVDVDGSLPNLALMKLGRYFRDLGRSVTLVHARNPRQLPDAAEVHASCVFSNDASARKVAALRERFNGVLRVGGSGVDLHLRLDPAVERLPADYSLDPELGDRAIGFLTRGCPMHCPFCIVPVKEGTPRRDTDFDTLLQGRTRLILLDDNLLAHPEADTLLEEMVRRRLRVNFNQTLDLRLLKPQTAALLRRISCMNVRFTRQNYYFSLNDPQHFDQLRDRYELLGTTGRDNVAFVFLYGYNTTLAQDIARLRFIRSLPGAYVFTQRYQPICGGPPPRLEQFFDDQADRHIDELLRINFTQNMKSMEVYYRNVCLWYASRRGRIHRRLVETLFRYNARPRMAGFLLKLQALAKERKDEPIT